MSLAAAVLPISAASASYSKRFGFSLEEIRQLLNLYDIGDKQKTQLAKTYELATERLQVMIAQRNELTTAIQDLKKMLQWGEEVMNSRGINIEPKTK